MVMTDARIQRVQEAVQRVAPHRFSSLWTPRESELGRWRWEGNCRSCWLGKVVGMTCKVFACVQAMWPLLLLVIIGLACSQHYVCKQQDLQDPFHPCPLAH